MSTRAFKTVAAINEASQIPFEWGRFDCCGFASHVAKLVTGVDFSTEFVYATEYEAVVIINAAGGLDALITKTLGVDSVGATTVDDGDPILLDLPNGYTVGVRCGDRAVCKTYAGVSSIPLTDHRVLIGWRLEDALCRRQ